MGFAVAVPLPYGGRVGWSEMIGRDGDKDRVEMEVDCDSSEETTGVSET